MNAKTVIQKKIVSVSVGGKTEDPAQVYVPPATPPAEVAARLQVITEQLKRPRVLNGRTYKLTTPLSNSSVYITLNDLPLNVGTEHEALHPFEVFINSRDMQNYQWVVVFTLMVSAIFRKGGDIKFIIEELKSVFDPAGGYFTAKGRVPSLVAEIGLIMEEHFKYIGLLPSDLPPEVKVFVEKKRVEYEAAGGLMANASICQKCGDKAVVMSSGCPTCLACGDSKCA